MDQLKLLGRSEETALIVDRIRSVAPVDRPLEILEAGCGQKWNLDLEGLRYMLTGVDLEAAALSIRMEKQKDMHNAIVGDLRTVPLPENSFDVIYCYFVLEHIQDAHSVLCNFVKWLRPGGIVIIKIPDPHSVQGVFARLTPHWFHILFYRYALGSKDAGKPGHGPYPTYFDPVVSRSGMHEFCSYHGLSLVEFGEANQYAATRWVHRLTDSFKRLVGRLTFERLSALHDDLLYIVARGLPAAGGASAHAVGVLKVE